MPACRAPDFRAGFTLLELLAALLILAFVAVASHHLLSALLETRRTQAERQTRFSNLSRSFALMARDFGESRPVPSPAPCSLIRGGADEAIFRPQSGLRLVSYRLEGNRLIREWSRLEQTDAPPVRQILMQGVESLECRPLSPRLWEVLVSVEGVGGVRRAFETAEP
jgi:prepilin-type N-terminal cleavage/methylation domain-containing protein